MTDVARLINMQFLLRMRHQLAQVDLQKATETERRRAEIAKDGRELQQKAEQAARDYVGARFADADLSLGAAGFFTSLAYGRRHAEREAILLARRADRLTERHNDAAGIRGDSAKHLMRCEQRLSQHAVLTDDILGQIRAADDEAEDEESQEIRAGRGHNGLS